MPTEEYELITGIVVTIIFFLMTGFFIVILFAYLNQRKKKHMQETALMKLSFQEELLKTQIEIQEQTLHTVSQEIHDNIGQMLSFVKLNLNTVNIDDRSDTIERLAASREIISSSLQALRDIARSLNPGFLDEIGLHAAIEQQLQILKKTGEYECSFRASGEVFRKAPEQEILIFRLVQELLNNIVKHAEAKSVDVEIRYYPDHLQIWVTDDGKGFEMSAVPSEQSGLGLRNMRNRVKLLNGSIDFSANGDIGTKVQLTIPR